MKKCLNCDERTKKWMEADLELKKLRRTVIRLAKKLSDCYLGEMLEIQRDLIKAAKGEK